MTACTPAQEQQAAGLAEGALNNAAPLICSQISAANASNKGTSAICASASGVLISISDAIAKGEIAVPTAKPPISN